MIKVKKNTTEIENIHTYFEFEDYDGWDEFDSLISVLTNEIKCSVVKMLDGIYSRHCILEKDSFVFKLMYHEDFGNCLCNKEKKDEVYYNKLECIAKEVVSNIGSIGCQGK